MFSNPAAQRPSGQHPRREHAAYQSEHVALPGARGVSREHAVERRPPDHEHHDRQQERSDAVLEEADEKQVAEVRKYDAARSDMDRRAPEEPGPGAAREHADERYRPE